MTSHHINSAMATVTMATVEPARRSHWLAGVYRSSSGEQQILDRTVDIPSNSSRIVDVDFAAATVICRKHYAQLRQSVGLDCFSREPPKSPKFGQICGFWPRTGDAMHRSRWNLSQKSTPYRCRISPCSWSDVDIRNSEIQNVGRVGLDVLQFLQQASVAYAFYLRSSSTIVVRFNRDRRSCESFRRSGAHFSVFDVR